MSFESVEFQDLSSARSSVEFSDLSVAADFDTLFEPGDFEPEVVRFEHDDAWGQTLIEDECLDVELVPVGSLNNLTDAQLPNSTVSMDDRLTLEGLIAQSDITELQLDTLYRLGGFIGDPASYAELAEERGVSLNGVKYAENRAIKNLQIAAMTQAGSKQETGRVATFEFYQKYLDRYHNWGDFMADIPPEYHPLYEKAAEVFDMSPRDTLHETKKVQVPPDVLDPLVSHRLIRTAMDLMHPSKTVPDRDFDNPIDNRKIWRHRWIYVLECIEQRHLARAGEAEEMSLRQSLVHEFGSGDPFLFRLYERAIPRDIANPEARAAAREEAANDFRRHLSHKQPAKP
jgi:hypothetical protein